MYIPDYFRIEDPEAIQKIVLENGLATLITPSPDGLQATHLPLLYEASPEGGIVNGHMARANNHWKSLDGVSESLAIFQGPNAYVSPEWYEESPAAPTWNFAVVHIRGVIRVIDELEWLSAHVDQLVDHHENRTLGHPAPTDSDFKITLIGGIVGLQMTVTSIEAKFKLNQNRSDADRLAVADALDASGNQNASDVGALMREHGKG
jgi:transcriptional regulator